MIRRFISIWLTLLITLPVMDLPVVHASTFDSLTNTAFDTVDDAGYGETSYAIRFGSTIQEEIRFDSTFSAFVFTDDMKVIGFISGSTLRVDGNAAVYGGLTVTGSVMTRGALSGRMLVVSGAASFSGTTTFQNGITLKNGGPLSGGTLRVTRNADIHGALAVTGAIRSDTNITLNDDADTNNVLLTFGSDTTNETLTWFNTADRFQFSDDVSVVGSISGSLLRIDGNADVHGALTASGSFRTDNNITLNDDADNSNVILTFGSDTTNETLTWLNTADKFYFSDDVDIAGTISGTTLKVWGAGPHTFSGSVSIEGALSGSTFYGAGLGDCSNGTSHKLLYNVATGRFGCGTDQTGGGSSGGGAPEVGTSSFSGGVLRLGDPRYVNTSGDTMTGALNIELTSADAVKTTTGNTNATDFSFAGSTLTNVTSTSDHLIMNNGPVPSSGQGTMATSSVAVGAAAGAGAHTILRDDGKYVIIRGNAANSAYVWDGISTTMTATATNPLSSGTVGAGAMSLRRPDGRYLVIAGGGVTTTGIFDPYGVVATSAGAAVCTTGATTGTSAFLTGSGEYLITCGGTSVSGIYQGVTNRFLALTTPTMAFAAGSFGIVLDDGRILVFSGGGTSTHAIFSPHQTVANHWSPLNPISSPPTITTGAFAIRRADGKYLIMGGALQTSTIYDPTFSAAAPFGTFTAQSGPGLGPTATLGDGAQAIERPDGKYLLMIGGATTTNIIDPTRTDSGQFTGGPAVQGGTPGAGAHMFINARGTVQIIHGGAATTTATYDMGYILGGNYTSTGAIYESECITVPNLHSGSTLTWNTNSDDYEMELKVRTGNGSCPSTEASYKTIATKNDYIRPTSGDNRAQLKVVFRRQLPKYIDQEWGLRKGLGQVQYRMRTTTPTLYDISILNRAMVRRTQFEFGHSNSPTGPAGYNLQNDGSRNFQIALANMTAYATTYSTTSAFSNIYNGAVGGHPSLATATRIGTVVMRRPDGKYVIISGGTSPNAQLYESKSMTIIPLGTTPTDYTGSGTVAFKRPDGKFFIVMGHDSKVTNIFDPIANTFTAGPNMLDRIGEGALAMQLPNGRVLILSGGGRRTSTVYDPFMNATATGAMTHMNIGRGAIAIPRPDGTFFILPGTSNMSCALQTLTMLYDPYVNQFRPNPGVAITTGSGPGSVAFERSDGFWVITRGGATLNTCAGVNTSNIYNPFGNRIGTTAGPTMSAVTRYGSTAVQRPDGNWLIVHGGATTTTTVYQEKNGTFSVDATAVGTAAAGPSLPAAVGTGSVMFMRDDGRMVLVGGSITVGTAGAGAMLVDQGWVSEGFYRSEPINIPGLDSNSTLSWRQTPAFGGVSASVRTGTSALTLNTKQLREIAYPGASISPGTGETYLQVNFALRRKFDQMPGLLEDVWYNGGTIPAQRFRRFATPTINEYSVGKDDDIVNLKADKLSLFRVNTNGDVYTGTKGALYSGGADLAERYLSADSLEPGELVTFDYTDDHSVRRSTGKYQPELLGVVSTNPGFVAGAYTKNSYPIALVGRVPVKVSIENGHISSGDRLTSSAIPGVAMKATRAGRVIGMALEPSKPESLTPCGADLKKQCATVMMFVNLSDWPGPIAREAD